MMYVYIESTNSYNKIFPGVCMTKSRPMPIASAVSFFLSPDRCYPLSTRARECEYGCKSTLECITSVKMVSIGGVLCYG